MEAQGFESDYCGIDFRVYFLAPGAEAYNSFLPCLTLYTLLAASLSWISVVRFKAGKQD